MAAPSHISRPLVLYGTLGCHLCEQAGQLLLPYVAEGWQVELMDIAEDDVLLERFALMIPVLECTESARLLPWPFDAVALNNFLFPGSGVAVRES